MDAISFFAMSELIAALQPYANQVSGEGERMERRRSLICLVKSGYKGACIFARRATIAAIEVFKRVGHVGIAQRTDGMTSLRFSITAHSA
jgi:hypothetical protein